MVRVTEGLVSFPRSLTATHWTEVRLRERAAGNCRRLVMGPRMTVGGDGRGGEVTQVMLGGGRPTTVQEKTTNSPSTAITLSGGPVILGASDET